ncbi:MAG: aminotransferase class IV family protein [Myxococcales bacterium]|nr:aminotransferase class IV family protein [Myxococcales bacterium]
MSNHPQPHATERFVKDGVVVSRDAYVVRGTDRGLTVGMSAFETLRTYAGRLFRLGEHLARLEGSVNTLGLPWPGAAVVTADLETAAAGLAPELGVRILITPETRLVHASPLDLSLVEKPLRVATRVWEPAPWLDGRVKHGSRAPSEVARQRAEVDEVFWVGRDGVMTEATRSSIFAVIDGRLVTPPDDGRILPGVTRSALIDTARELGLEVIERGISPREAMNELYASSTLKELSPVVELDGNPAPGGGPVGRRLLLAFRALVVRECSG